MHPHNYGHFLIVDRACTLLILVFYLILWCVRIQKQCTCKFATGKAVQTTQRQL